VGGIDNDIKTVVHIRRGGDISGQQLGQYMLEKIRAAGGRRMTGEVRGIKKAGYQVGSRPSLTLCVIYVSGSYQE